MYYVEFTMRSFRYFLDDHMRRRMDFCSEYASFCYIPLDTTGTHIYIYLHVYKYIYIMYLFICILYVCARV